VANLDVLFVVIAAAEPEPQCDLADKLIAIAEYNTIEPVVIVTKADIDPEAAAEIIIGSKLKSESGAPFESAKRFVYDPSSETWAEDVSYTDDPDDDSFKLTYIDGRNSAGIGDIGTFAMIRLGFSANLAVNYTDHIFINGISLALWGGNISIWEPGDQGLVGPTEIYILALNASPFNKGQDAELIIGAGLKSSTGEPVTAARRFVCTVASGVWAEDTSYTG